LIEEIKREVEPKKSKNCPQRGTDLGLGIRLKNSKGPETKGKKAGEKGWEIAK